MKFTTQNIVGSLFSIFSILSTALVNPLGTDIAFPRTANTQMVHASDGLIASGLDYIIWVNKMVDEGNMHWPNVTSTRVIEAAGVTWSIKNIACGIVIGPQSTYEQGETDFCNLAQIYAGVHLRALEYLVNDAACSNGAVCGLRAAPGNSF